MLSLTRGSTGLALSRQRDVTRVEPEPAGSANPGRGVPEYVRRQVSHLTALRALGVQMLGPAVRGRGWRPDQVVRGQAAVEMNVAEHTGGGQPFERAIDGRPVNRRIAPGQLVLQVLGREMLATGGEQAGEHGDPRPGDPLTYRAQQRRRLAGEGVATATTGHPHSLHRSGGRES
jgi:hypothetical protein